MATVCSHVIRALLPVALLASQAANAGDKAVVLVLTSDSSPRSTEIVRTFKAETAFAVRMSYDLGAAPDPAAFIAENLAEFDPAVVVTVGDLALKAASREWALAPILALEADPVIVARLSRANLLQVGGRVAAEPLFASFATLLPGAREVGMVRLAGDDDPWWGQLAAASEAAGLDLVVEDVHRLEELAAAQRRLVRHVDLLLAQPDPRLWTSTALFDALDLAARARVPVATFSAADLKAEVSPAFAITAGAEGVGHEAARMCREIVEGGAQAAEVVAAAPELMLIGDRRALLRGMVPLTKKTTAVIDAWTDAKSSEEE